MNIRIYQILFSALVLFSACSDNDSSKEAGGASEAENSIAIEDKTIAGVSEKGPFINGSAVTIYELDFENLGQTGRTYTGKIASDHGDFRFTHVNLVSQYALLEVNGFYRNEITGKESVAPITLNAMVDFSDRRTANINLLTHLAYARMQYLVDDGVSVLEAKKQAEKEILKAFYIQGDVEEFEDLSIFEAGDGNAALLAISILMQGDLNEAKFSSRLANFAYDIEKDGVWEDSVTATQIADWAFGADYNQIETNIKSWNLGSKIPDFRPFVKHYWWYNFGLGDCSSKNDGEEKQVSNKLSTHTGEMFVCKNSDWTWNDPWFIWLGDHCNDYSPQMELITKNDVHEMTFANACYVGMTYLFNFDSTSVDLYSNCATRIIHYKYKGNNHSFEINSLKIPAEEYHIVNTGNVAQGVVGTIRGEEWTDVLIPIVDIDSVILKNTIGVRWTINADQSQGYLQVKDYGCLPEEDLYKVVGLEKNCKQGVIENKYGHTYLCKDGAWEILNSSQAGFPCAEQHEGEAIGIGFPIFICKDNALKICSNENKCEEVNGKELWICNGFYWRERSYYSLEECLPEGPEEP